MKKLLIFAVCLMFFLSPAYAKKNLGEIEPQVEKEKSIKKLLDYWINVKIITPEKEIIKRHYKYYHQNNLKRAKGKKKKVLPPGLKKKLARGGIYLQDGKKKSSVVK